MIVSRLTEIINERATLRFILLPENVMFLRVFDAFQEWSSAAENKVDHFNQIFVVTLTQFWFAGRSGTIFQYDCYKMQQNIA